MLRRCVLTVFGETDSSLAISDRDRLVGRYRSTLSSPGLSSSAGGNEDCSLAAGDEPCRTSSMSASSAACAVWCRGTASSSPAEPVIANGRISRSDSARASGPFSRLAGRALVAELAVGEPGQQVSLNDLDVPEDWGRAIEDIGHRG